MTQLELELSRGAYKITLIFDLVLSAFRKFGKAVLKARQDKANRIIVSHLKTEYPNESYDYILRLVKEGRVNEIGN